MKYRILTIISVAALFLTSCYKDDINNLQKQIDELKNSEIASISTQITNITASISDLQKTENALNGYITSLQTDNESIKKQILALGETNKSLSTKINDLTYFVNNELKDMSDWAAATFVTLAHFDSISVIVAALPTQVASITSELDSVQAKIVEGYEKSIKDAVESSEESMKSWINEKFVDYYTITEVNSVLDSIVAKQSLTDSTLYANILEQKVALDTAKSQITVAYKKAIKEAIDGLEGKLNTKIATDIASAQKALDNQIQYIQSEINAINGKIQEFETKIAALINRIQSIVVVPSYSDGSVQVLSTAGLIKFDVRPHDVAKELVKLAAQDSSIFSFAVVETIAKTMTDDPGLDITAFAYNTTTQYIDVTVDATSMGAAFFNKTKNFSASFIINSGYTNKSSNYFSLYPQALSLYNSGAPTINQL